MSTGLTTNGKGMGMKILIGSVVASLMVTGVAALVILGGVWVSLDWAVDPNGLALSVEWGIK